MGVRGNMHNSMPEGLDEAACMRGASMRGTSRMYVGCRGLYPMALIMCTWLHAPMRQHIPLW